jgi:hypothetical protein
MEKYHFRCCDVLGKLRKYWRQERNEATIPAYAGVIGSGILESKYYFA